MLGVECVCVRCIACFNVSAQRRESKETQESRQFDMKEREELIKDTIVKRGLD